MPRPLAFPILAAPLAYLLGIATERDLETAVGIALGVKKTHAGLACLLGAMRETIRETLLDLRRRGLLAAHGRSILLAEPAALRAHAASAHAEVP